MKPGAGAFKPGAGALKGPVLVTGAGGFIGGRVVELLHQAEVPVRAGVHRWSSAARIGRLPVEIVACDVMDREQVGSVTRGVRSVVHCARGDRDVNVEGTRNLLEASLAAGVERAVHLSTIAVYGDATGEVDESTPLQPYDNEYATSKLESEAVCREYAERGLPVTVLRPTIVYGPFSEGWTVEFAERLRSGRWLLPDAYTSGICNLLYVDDLVRAIFLALEREEAVAGAFNINGPDRVTWGGYFRALNAALGLGELRAEGATTSRLSAAAMMPVRKTAKLLLARFEEPILALYKRYGVVKKAMKAAEGLIRQTPTTGEFELYSQDVHFSNARAGRVLGYTPVFDMGEGVRLSAAWLRHHRYV